MTGATLWIEITIAGAVYVAGVAFIILAALGVRDFVAVASGAAPFMPYLAAAGVAVSYIVGIVAHRTVQVLARPVLAPLERALHLAELTNRIPSDVLTTGMVAIWQRGSSRLHREVDFQYALVALIRSLLLSVPFVGLTSAIWLIVVGTRFWWLPPAAAAISWPLVFAAYRRQWAQYQNLRIAAWRELGVEPDRATAGALPVAGNIADASANPPEHALPISPPNIGLQPSAPGEILRRRG